MTKFIFILLFLMPLSLFAQDDAMELSPDDGTPVMNSIDQDVSLEPSTRPVPETQTSPEITPVMNSTEQAAREYKNFNPFQSHWLIVFNGESSTWDVPWNFEGEKKNFKASKQYVAGGRVALGREFHLGKGLFTTTKGEGFYQGSLFTSAKNAGPEDENIEFAFTKDKASIWGFEAAQSISYVFEMKTKNPFMGDYSYLTFEPFIEAGLGTGWAYNTLEYKYQLTSANEYYRHRISDQFTTARIGLGLNITSSQGFLLFLRVTQNRYDISERKSRGEYREDGGIPVSLKGSEENVDIDPVTVFALGGGYKF